MLGCFDFVTVDVFVIGGFDFGPDPIIMPRKQLKRKVVNFLFRLSAITLTHFIYELYII